MLLRNNRRIKIVSGIMIFCIIAVVASRGKPESVNCIQSFSSFAYGGPTPRPSSSAGFPEAVSLRPPWIPELRSIELQGEAIHPHLFSVLLTREIAHDIEVWISLTDGQRGPFAHYLADSHEGRAGFAVYRNQSHAWELISQEIGSSGLYVVELFVDSRGNIWGQTHSSVYKTYPQGYLVPILSKFNETSRRFEFAEGVLEIPLASPQLSSNNPNVFIDSNDVFWIFTHDGSVYSYDTQSSSTDVVAGVIPVGYILDIARSPTNNDLYLAVSNSSIIELHFRGISLVEFSPASRTSKTISYPIAVGDWPLYSGLLFDLQGNLWFGAIGLRDKDDRWELLDSNYSFTYEAHLGQYMWSSPELMMQSADGKMWFRKYLDTAGWSEGTAWYDANTGNGCVITNVASNIVEDKIQGLWIVINGALYNLPSTTFGAYRMPKSITRLGAT